MAGKKTLSQNFVFLLLIASLGLNFFYFFKYSPSFFSPPGSPSGHPGGVSGSAGSPSGHPGGVSGSAGSPSGHPGGVSNGEVREVGVVGVVDRVIDGDTLDLEDGTRIRLAYIDAPEYQEECYSYDAKVLLEKLVLEKNVRIEPIEKDNFGRTVALVYIDDVLIDEILLREGAAEFRPSTAATAYDLRLERAQSEAKSLQKGIWSDVCTNKLDPNCQIKANARHSSGTKIYHLPNCQNYERIVIDEKRGDRWFCTEEEAAAAGFMKSKACI